MARRRNRNRHRRGRFGFLYKMLSVLAICGAIIAALTLFFRVDSIVITGEERYSEQEIVDATGLRIGDNLFLLNKYAIAEDLLKKLPYITAVRINRELPDTLTIDVTESCAALFAVQDGSAWLISPDGKIVEQRTPGDAGELAELDGCRLLAPSVSTQIALETERADQQESLLALLAALDGADMLQNVQAIHLDDLTVLRMDYAERFTVELPYNANYPYKMRALQAILDSGRIESNETGTIRMTGSDGQNVFIKG